MSQIVVVAGFNGTYEITAVHERRSLGPHAEPLRVATLRPIQTPAGAGYLPDGATAPLGLLRAVSP